MDWLLTWVGQGLVLTLLVWGGLRLAPSVTASTRYVVWWATLLAVLALPLIGGDGRAVVEPIGSGAGWGVPEWVVALGIGIWLGTVVLRLSRVARTVERQQRHRRGCTTLPAACERDLSMWRTAREHGRPMRVAASDDVAVPTVLGLINPVIAMPWRVVTRFDAAEIDQLVLHETGRVQRWDDWSQLVQSVIDAFVGLHPAVWMVNRFLTFEREAACDEWVVAHTGGPEAYVDCLAKLGACVKPLRGRRFPAAGIVRDLPGRLGRVLRRGAVVSPQPSWATAAASSLALVMTVALAGRLIPPPGPGGSPDRTVQTLSEAASVSVAVSRSDAQPRVAQDAEPPASDPLSVRDIEAEVMPTLPARRIPVSEYLVASAVTDHLDVTGFSLARLEPPGLGQLGGWLRRGEAPPLGATAVVTRVSMAPAAPARALTAALWPVPEFVRPLESEQDADRGIVRWTVVADAGQAVADAGHAVAGAGQSVGVGAKRAGLAMVGFFARLGSSVTRVF